jgi:hypothetical protein
MMNLLQHESSVLEAGAFGICKLYKPMPPINLDPYTSIVNFRMKILSILSAAALVGASIAIPYDAYILAPRSRTLHPVSVHNTNGSVSNPESLTGSNGSSIFDGDAATSYDFGINIAGVVSLNIDSVSSSSQYIGVTFSESSYWVSNASSDATADAGKDETLWFHVTKPGRYTAPREKERGAFRYMTLVHNSTGTVEVTSAEVHYTAMPHWGDDAIADYTGYFHCDGKLGNMLFGIENSSDFK